MDNYSSEQTVSFNLNEITFESDTYFSKEEFFYLTDLKENTIVTSKDIEKACKQLLFKKRISKIDIDISEENGKKNLNFRIYSNWIFNKLSLKNIFIDKQQYTSLYMLQQGDIFDICQHEESVKAIKEYLHDKGYFNCKITDELFYKKTDKTISAKIKIDKKSRFIIKKINFDIKSLDNEVSSWLSNSEISDFKSRLTRKISSSLVERHYSKVTLIKKVDQIKKFIQKRGFLNPKVKIRRLINKKQKCLYLIFQISLGKRKIISFVGNKFFTEKQLKTEFLGLDYPDWLFDPELISEHILYEYYKKGFRQTSIKYTVKDKNFYIFNIEEGFPLIIKQVQLKDLDAGNIIEQNIFFNTLLKTGVFDENILDKCLEDLKKYYLNNGYWDFACIKKHFIKTQTDKEYILLLDIKKGKQRFWNGFNIEKFENLKKESFFKKYLKNKKALIPFDFYWLAEQKLFLLNYFQNQGYWYVNVQPELKATNRVDLDGIDIFVNWKIDLGPQIRFGKILLQGSTNLPFKRILKEVTFEEGDLFNRSKIDSTRKRLKKLDLFKNIQIQNLNTSKKKKDYDQPIILTLLDDDPIQARIRAGYFLTSKNFLFKQASTYKIGGSFIFKNPTNHADKISLNADVTKFEQKFNLDYQLPSPFGLTIEDTFVNGKLKGYFNRNVNPVEIFKSGSAYESMQTGLLAGLSSEYQKGHYWSINLGNECIKTSQVRGNLKFNKNLIGKTLPYFYLEPNLLIDKLNDRVNIKNGSLSYLALKFSVPEYLGDVTAKLMFEQSLYCQIHSDFVLAFRARVGHIFRHKFENIQPIDRFFLGGPFSVRGYEVDSIPPYGEEKKIKPDETTKKVYTIQGGSSMLNGNLELRFPIYKSFGGVAFQDVGILSQSGFNGFKEKWYPSSGFGLRYKTPIGAIRFDIGWKWKKQFKKSGDTSYAWYLTLGEAF